MNSKELAARVDNAFLNEFNHTSHAYIDITGDLIAGTLLSQIMYWFNPDKNGKLKVRVFKEGSFWLAKKRDEWYSEIRISPKQYDRAIKILTEKGFVEVKRFKFNGDPITHVRPLYENINTATTRWKSEKAEAIVKAYSTDGEIPTESKAEQGGNSFFTFGEVPTLPTGNNQLDDRGSSLTEITTEITNNKDIYMSAELTEEEVAEHKKKTATKKKVTVRSVLYEGIEYHTKQEICNLVKDLYNKTCVSLPKVRAVTDKREKAIIKLVDKYGIDQIVDAFKIAETREFLKGSNNRGWVANFDFVTREDAFIGILEGKYDNKGGTKSARNEERHYGSNTSEWLDANPELKEHPAFKII